MSTLLEMLTISLGISLHAGFDNKYNAVHPHIRYQNEKLISGVFYNSLDRLGWYGGARWEHGDFGIEGVMTTGYNYLLSPSGRVTYDYKDNVRVFVNPGLEDKNIGVVMGIEIMSK
jgi:hypothetical protein